MRYPEFFDKVPTIRLRDDLSDFLGTFENGEIEFSYVDVAKSAGHSCPTVAGAYLLCLEGLKALYKDEMPVRGEILVAFKEDEKEGVAGVIANVVTQITGATKILGFKGINGEYVRHSLLSFNEEINSSVKFTRTDTNESVEVIYDHSQIPGNPKQQELMGKVLMNMANEDERQEFRNLWQGRVQQILENPNKVIVIK